MKKVAIDLRGLNYKHFNGVNTYTLLFLNTLYAIKQNSPFSLTAIGLEEGSYKNLTQNYSFTKDLFDQRIPTSEYLNIPSFSNQQITAYLLFKLIFNQNLRTKKALKFNKVILVQPKILNFHPGSQVLTIFHDIFGILGYNTTGFKQKIVENKTVFKSLVKTSNQVWGNSISTCNDVQDYLGAKQDQIKLVYPFLPQKPTQKPNKHKKKQYLAISGIEPRKNWYNLILAHHFCCLNYQDFDLELILVGRVVNQKYFNKLQRLIQKKSINRVKFVIDASQEQKDKLLSQSQFTIYPSLWEGFGFPILESLAYNKPVITSKISSMPELAKDSGVYVNPLNPKEIAVGIYLLHQDKKYYKNLAKNCPKNLKFFDQSELQNCIQKFLFE